VISQLIYVGAVMTQLVYLWLKTL